MASVVDVCNKGLDNAGTSANIDSGVAAQMRSVIKEACLSTPRAWAT